MTRMIRIFTDGACAGNPGPGGWAAILAANDRVKEIGGPVPATTNNRMELTAAIEALRAIQSEEVQIELYTDSQYVIQGASQWIHGWRRNGWMNSQGKPVENRDLWEDIGEQVDRFRSKLRFLYVPGHAGIPGNERCDALSVAFSQGNEPALFEGTRVGYGIDLDTVADSSPAKNKGGTVYYLSYVHGQVYRDSSWRACEARVKGVMGARYRKCSSPEQEEEILRQWGVKA